MATRIDSAQEVAAEIPQKKTTKTTLHWPEPRAPLKRKEDEVVVIPLKRVLKKEIERAADGERIGAWGRGSFRTLHQADYVIPPKERHTHARGHPTEYLQKRKRKERFMLSKKQKPLVMKQSRRPGQSGSGPTVKYTRSY